TPQITPKKARITSRHPTSPPAIPIFPRLKMEISIKMTNPTSSTIPMINVMTAFLETFFSENDNAFLEIILSFLFLFALLPAARPHKAEHPKRQTVTEPASQSSQRVHQQIVHIKHADLCHQLQSLNTKCK